MTSLRDVLRKPYDYALRKVGLSRTEKGISPSQKTAKGANVFASILSPFETYVVSFQSLLIWERPYLSAAAFVTVNCLYWLIVSWNRRFFSILSLAALFLFVYRTWINQIWPEIKVPPAEGEDTEEWTTINPQVLSVPEISKYLNDFLEKMIILWRDVWRLRKENHGLFCALMCGFLSLLALFGHLIPGVLIIYVAVLIFSLGPGIALHLIPSTLYDQVVGYFAESDALAEAEADVSKSGGNSDEDSYLEEFLPETSAAVIRQLSLREDSLDVTGPTRVLSDLAEDVENDVRELGVESYENENDDLLLYQGLGAFPSVEEEGESDIEDDISDDIVPKLEPEKSGMHFDASHFKEESSGSESDAVFTEGLSFSGAQDELTTAAGSSTKPKPKTLAGAAEKNVESGKDLPAVRKISSSSDLDDELMDFEILEESEIHS